MLIPNKVQGLLPQFVVRTRFAADVPTLYLTFDDGPSAYSLKIAQMLEEMNAKATFFVIGKYIAEKAEILEQLVAAGHSIGNHSMRHQAFASQPLHKQLAEIQDVNRLLQAYGGSVGFRAPQGRITLGLMWSLLRSNEEIVHWSVDSLDYRGDVELVLKRFQQTKLKSGDILLFHDDNDTAQQALEILLPQWQKQGFTIQALPR